MEWIKDFVIQNGIGLLSLLISPILAYLISRRKDNATIKKTNVESDSIVVDSSGKLVANWQTFANEVKEELAECTKQNSIQAQQNETLISQNKSLINRFEILESKMKAYVDGTTKIFNLMLLEIEKTSPEFAFSIKENFQELSKIFESLEYGKQTKE